MQSSPGVYALLLGSGVSRAAKIPTGWEITLDLVRKLADLEGAASASDLEAWYVAKYGKQPDYSDLLDTIAKTPTERQQLLRSYWEPTDEERAEGVKQPTSAHRSIASLVSKGYVRIIVTTNFDTLIEDALRDAGVQPNVVSSLDQLQGVMPLTHLKDCVFKVHGDYRDTRIRNTPDELASYPEAISDFLYRVFDEFGLVVCGWSADWDTALRNALYCAPSRRFATYWTAHEELGHNAKSLIQHRGAQETPIADADTFFAQLQRNIESVAGTNPKATPTDVAVDKLKHDLSRPEYRISFSDSIDKAVDEVRIAINSDEFMTEEASPPTKDSVTARLRAYEGVCSTLLEMASVGGRWAEDYHYSVWERALRSYRKYQQAATQFGSDCVSTQVYSSYML